jgi:hypothetical protein
VEVEDAAAKKSRFVSACAVVEGVERELLVLPRRTGETNPDGTDVRYGLQVPPHAFAQTQQENRHASGDSHDVTGCV